MTDKMILNERVSESEHQVYSEAVIRCIWWLKDNKKQLPDYDTYCEGGIVCNFLKICKRLNATSETVTGVNESSKWRHHAPCLWLISG